MTAVSRNTTSIVDHLSDLTATVSDWIGRLEGVGNVPIRQAKFEQSVASPPQTPALPPQIPASPSHTPASPSHTPTSLSQTRPVKILRQIGDDNVPLLKEDGCTVKASSFFGSQSSALADLPPSQITSLTGQFLTPSPQKSSPMVTTKQSSFTDQNPRKRKASLVIKAYSTPDLRSRFVEVYFDGATLKTLEGLVKDLTKFAGGIYRHLRNANAPTRMNVIALEVDDEDDGCENGDVEEEKIDLSVLRLQFVSTRRMRPSYDQTGLPTSQPSTFADLKKGLADCENECDKAAQSLLKYGSCNSEIGEIRSKLEELKKMAEKEIEMLSVK